MIAALLSPRVLIGLAILAAIGTAYIKGRSDGAAPAVAKLERERTAWANERTKAAEIHAQALQSEIRAHNQTRNELEADRENAEARVAVAEKRADAAEAAASAARYSDRRMRDALATHRVATDAALEAAGAASLCAPATQAARMYADMLGSYRARAESLGRVGQASGIDSERQHAAASECADRADTMIRNSGGTE